MSAHAVANTAHWVIFIPIVACLSLGLLWAISDAVFVPNRDPDRRFLYNRGVRFVLILSLAGAVLGVVAWLAYVLGGCHEGFNATVECANVSVFLGQLAFNLSWMLMMIGFWLCLPIAGLLIICETVTRQRQDP
ncbi:MAG: hypothetical protein AAFV19_13955 [Pseudomonadota bacterium]